MPHNDCAVREGHVVKRVPYTKHAARVKASLDACLHAHEATCEPLMDLTGRRLRRKITTAHPAPSGAHMCNVSNVYTSKSFSIFH